jgi:hypothetical protein
LDDIQDRHERAVGDAFISWYNQRNATGYTYHDRGADPPDRVYRFEAAELPLEITGAYYDADYAKMEWQNARGLHNAPDCWGRPEPDEALIADVNAVVAKKCAKKYPPHCLLVVNVNPAITSADEFSALVSEVRVPPTRDFAGIYVGGAFPESSWGSHEGYYFWKLA